MRKGVLLCVILLMTAAVACARQSQFADATVSHDPAVGNLGEPASTPSPEPEPSIDERVALRFAAGDRHLELAEYHLAAEEYGEAIRLDPDLAEAHYKRAGSFVQLRHLVRAIEDYERALGLDPGYASDPVFRHDIGFAYHHQRMYLRAIEHYDEALRLDPHYAEAHKNRGLAYAGLRQYERAIENYDVAIALNPEYVGAYNNRGLAYGSLGDYERAVIEYDQAIRLDPDFAKSYAGRALAYAFLGRGSDAIRDARRAVELGIERASLDRLLEQIRLARQVPDEGY